MNASLQRSLPALAYFDSSVMEAEWEKLWFKQWLYVCRRSELAESGQYKVIEIGGQQVLLTQNKQGELKAFYNTCRHRGSELCSDPDGKFNGGRIVCPYHRWAFSLDGELVNIPFADGEINGQELGLYPVHSQTWGGNIYINLSKNPSSELGKDADPYFGLLDNWPLEELVVGHRHDYTLKCNWKVVWENYLECYHCPGLHPELCELVPLYKETLATDMLDGVSGTRDAVAEGVESWTMDGKAIGPNFPSLTADEVKAGHVYLSLPPNQWIVGHPDYVRQVSFMPIDAETTQIFSEWLFSQEFMDCPDLSPERAIEFGELVLGQDAVACEINQRGMTALPHEAGFLVAPQEDDLGKYHDWYRALMENK